MSCALILEDFELSVNLGVTPAERNKKQLVVLYIKIYFAKIPRAARTRKISDTVCYAGLTKKIQKFCQAKKFVLLEELSLELLHLLQQNIPQGCKLYLRVAKQRPLRNLARSVCEITK